MKKKLFTKSAFKQALSCPTSLYYYRNPNVYANQNLNDEFLESLAEGGFQVGEAAKVYYGISEEDTIKELGYEDALSKTSPYLQMEKARVAEAAFRYGNCFIRADLLIKDGNRIKLIEVKSRSWDPETNSFWQARDGQRINTKILPYVYDVAFQKWVVCNALKEQFPDEKFDVTAYLMMADKTTKAPIDGINQMFRIVDDNGRKSAERTPDASQLYGTSPVVVAFDVDEICDKIIEGKTGEQTAVLNGYTFIEFIKHYSKLYCENEREWAPISTGCYKCPFHKVKDDTSNLMDGFRECWKNALGWRDAEFDEPLLSDLNGIKKKFFEAQCFKLQDIEIEPGYSVKDACGLDHSDRNILIAGMLTGRREILDLFGDNIRKGVYLNRENLKAEMDGWVYPLHMIDFETSAVALPFYKGMRPYESVAFQFSHHIINKNDDGSYSIEHKGQFINVEKGHFPNFDFLRALKKELAQDCGSIFRYSHHENTILNHIADQLKLSDEPDKEELTQFIDMITHRTSSNAGGPRDMIDLCEVVKRNYYHPLMRGSNSIKYVLPAVLNSSDFIKEKYSKAIYGREIPSLNIPSDSPVAWITIDSDGKTVLNPYKLLPPLSDYLNMDEATAEAIGDAAESQIANGGAALTAYSELQFSDNVMSDALSKALLRYCELDTMAMVFLWEYFYSEIFTQYKPY